MALPLNGDGVRLQGDRPDNVKFPDNSMTVFSTRHVKCYSYPGASIPMGRRGRVPPNILVGGDSNDDVPPPNNLAN